MRWTMSFVQKTNRRLLEDDAFFTTLLLGGCSKCTPCRWMFDMFVLSSDSKLISLGFLMEFNVCFLDGAFSLAGFQWFSNRT